VVFTSTFPPVVIPESTVFDYLFGGLSAPDRERVALIDAASGEQTTYGDLVTQIELVAGALAARGVGPGVVIALHAPNSAAFASVFHGILRAGATSTTINVLYTPGEIAGQLSDSKARVLFTVSPLLEQALEAAASAGLARESIVVIDGAAGFRSLADLLGEGNAAPSIEIDPAETVAVLPYSSGTTARPKGVILTHRNLVANVAQSQLPIATNENDRILAILPFFHIYGMTVLLNLAFSTRSALVTMPKFELTEFLRSIQDHRITWVFIAPPVAVALAKHPLIDDYDLSSLSVVFSGAAPLDGALGAAVATRLGCLVRQGYGMSEMSPVSHAIPFDRDDIPLSSVGLTLPNMECKLIDPQTGDEIEIPATGVSEPGELLCRGPNVMRGYLGNEEATAQTIDPDGFIHTGDIATVSAHGYVTIVDRLKELIKYKGYQVAPAELEALLLTHELIADAAVIGVNDAEGEEIPKAFVVLQPDAELSEDEVIAFVAGRVAPYKKVREVEFIETVPKSASGKILRKDLRT